MISPSGPTALTVVSAPSASCATPAQTNSYSSTHSSLNTSGSASTAPNAGRKCANFDSVPSTLVNTLSSPSSGCGVMFH